jgi:hypothetical protein
MKKSEFTLVFRLSIAILKEYFGFCPTYLNLINCYFKRNFLQPYQSNGWLGLFCFHAFFDQELVRFFAGCEN